MDVLACGQQEFRALEYLVGRGKRRQAGMPVPLRLEWCANQYLVPKWRKL